MQSVLLGCLRSDFQSIFVFPLQSFFRIYSHSRPVLVSDFISVSENFCRVSYQVCCFHYICSQSRMRPLHCGQRLVPFMILFSCTVFLPIEGSLPPISIPIGCTPASRQGASYEVYLYTFDILMLISLWELCIFRRSLFLWLLPILELHKSSEGLRPLRK